MAELDIENPDHLADYLRVCGYPAIAKSRILTGGVSNRTIVVYLKSDQSWVLKQALPKLRTKTEWFSDPARVHREALGIRWLSKLAPPGTIPEFVFEDFEHHILAMQAVPEPHENWKEMLLTGRLSVHHVEQFAALLASIHRQAAELGSTLAEAFADRSYFESLRLEPYYGFAASQVPEASAFLSALTADTHKRLLTLVHGDYSPKNVLVHKDRLVLLDHEVIHWGDPAFDVGFALTHLFSKLHHLKKQSFAVAIVRFLEVYQAQAGARIWNEQMQSMTVRHTLGCLLARVAGRSPLEYLSADERTRQQVFVVGAMNAPITSVDELLMTFIRETGPYGED